MCIHILSYFPEEINIYHGVKSKMTKKTQIYDESVITMLKGEDRVRKRPAVIFGSDGIEGCEHSAFEIISNAVD